jgi:hypothetical protein
MMHSARLSIAGLMGVVVVAALGFAALRSPSPTSAGIAIIATCGVLSLAWVGAICRKGSARTWWLGLALFGCMYIATAYLLADGPGEFPTVALLVAVASKLGAAPVIVAGFEGPQIDPNYRWIGHCVWSLALGLLGAVLASLLFSKLPVTTEQSDLDPEPKDSTARRFWHRPNARAIALFALILAVTLALLGSTSDFGLWSVATMLVTLGILGLAVLGAVFGRAKARARWFGGALFGLGYLMLVFLKYPDLEVWPYLATDTLMRAFDPLLRRVIPRYADSPESMAVANARVWRLLQKPIPIHFHDTALVDVVKHIQDATRGPDRKRLSIYVDPLPSVGNEALPSTVQSADLEGIPLRRSLQLCLEQNELSYYVRDGILHIYAPFGVASIEPDTSLLVGHCLVALFAAGIGAIAAGAMWSPGRGTIAPTSESGG